MTKLSPNAIRKNSRGQSGKDRNVSASKMSLQDNRVSKKERASQR